MNLEYARDKYKQLENILNDKEDLDNQQLKEINRELHQLGEADLIDNIQKMSESEQSKFLIKEMFKEVLGHAKPEINTQAYKVVDDGRLEEIGYENTLEISTKKDYSSEGEIYINIKNYDEDKKYRESEYFLKFITVSPNIQRKIETISFEGDEINLKLKYKIFFEKDMPEKVYREYISIAFENLQSKMYEFTIKCRNVDDRIYDFDFKSIDDLYQIFKDDAKKYKKNKASNESLTIEQIFNKDYFEEYIEYLEAYEALNLYKNLNIKVYTINDIDLFFRVLGYKSCVNNVRTNTKKIAKNTPKDIVIQESIRDEIDFNKLFNVYYIEDLDLAYKFEIYNNRERDVRIRKCSDLLHPIINKSLSFIFKNKMKRFNSSIIIDDTNRFKHMIKYYIKKEYINTNCKVLIYTKKSEQERNLYQLKIHM